MGQQVGNIDHIDMRDSTWGLDYTGAIGLVGNFSLFPVIVSLAHGKEFALECTGNEYMWLRSSSYLRNSSSNLMFILRLYIRPPQDRHTWYLCSSSNFKNSSCQSLQLRACGYRERGSAFHCETCMGDFLYIQRNLGYPCCHIGHSGDWWKI